MFVPKDALGMIARCCARITITTCNCCQLRFLHLVHAAISFGNSVRTQVRGMNAARTVRPAVHSR